MVLELISYEFYTAQNDKNKIAFCHPKLCATETSKDIGIGAGGGVADSQSYE